jgi:hypothetical protein
MCELLTKHVVLTQNGTVVPTVSVRTKMRYKHLTVIEKYVTIPKLVAKIVVASADSRIHLLSVFIRHFKYLACAMQILSTVMRYDDSGKREQDKILFTRSQRVRVYTHTHAHARARKRTQGSGQICSADGNRI